MAKFSLIFAKNLHEGGHKLNELLRAASGIFA
jgi:hypothetical protein